MIFYSNSLQKRYNYVFYCKLIKSLVVVKNLHHYFGTLKQISQMLNLKKILLTILMTSVFCTLLIRAMEKLDSDQRRGINLCKCPRLFYELLIHG